MHFAQILSECIEAVAQGQSVEAVLALHPEDAEALAPLLHLVVSLQPQSTAQLSDHAFQHGRAVLVDAARRKRALSTPIEPVPPVELRTHHRRFTPYRNGLSGAHAARPSPTSPLTNGQPNTALPQNATTVGGLRPSKQSRSLTDRRHTHAKRAAARKRPAGLSYLRQFAAVLLPIMLILMTAGLLQQAANSMPGSPLYRLKTVSEQSQGLLMTAAGEGATWHANQMLRRLAELAQMTTAAESAGTPLTDELAVATLASSVAARATVHAEQALDASALLSAADQRTFLARWLTELETVEHTLQQSSIPSERVWTLLQKTKGEVIAATEALDPSGSNPIDREELLIDPTALAEPPTALPLVTAPPVATTAAQPIVPRVNLLPTATPVLRATAIPTPSFTPVQIQPAFIPPTIAPTATALPIMTQVIPMEQPSGNQPDEDSSSTDPTSTDGRNGAGTDEGNIDSGGNNSAETNDEPTSPENDSGGVSPTSDIQANEETTTAVPSGSGTPTVDAEEEAVTTAVTLLPTDIPPLSEPTGLPSVEPDGTISAPVLPTTQSTAVDPGQDEDATATPVAQSTGIVLDEGPVPILVTGVPPASSATGVPTPTQAAAQETGEVRPTRTRRPTATPTPVTDPPATHTPETVESISTAAPTAVDGTTVAEPTDILTP